MNLGLPATAAAGTPRPNNNKAMKSVVMSYGLTHSLLKTVD